MLNLFKKKQTEVYSPIEGEIIAITEVNDPVFSEKMMGEGFAVKPTTDTVCSPIAGKIASVFPTKHAVSVVADNGDQILIHIGLDTVELNGEGFQSDIKEGQKVGVGDPLVKVDMNYLKEKGKDTVVIVVAPELAGKELSIQNDKAKFGEVVATIK